MRTIQLRSLGMFVACCLLFAACGKEQKSSPVKPVELADLNVGDVGYGRKFGDANKLELAVLAETNREREQEGLPALNNNAKLNAAALKHAINMAQQKKMAHELDGKKPIDRIRAIGYRVRATGENVAYGQPSAAVVVDQWMHSPGHRKNILLDKFTELGVGVYEDTDGMKYWCQSFGRPIEADDDEQPAR